MNASQKKKLKEALEVLGELEKLLDERVVDFYEVKGMMQARHAYCYYRKYVWEVQRIVRDSLFEKEPETNETLEG